MTVEGAGQIIRNAGTGSGCIVFIDDLSWEGEGNPEFTITVEADVTLVIAAWLQPSHDTAMFVTIDGVEIDPMTTFAEIGGGGYNWPAMFWTQAAGLSAGSHTVGLAPDVLSGLDGGLAVFHVLDTCFEEQAHT